MLGFSVSGHEHAGWLQPVFQGQAEWLTGGAFGPESSIFSPVVSAVVIVLLWRWKGSVAPTTIDLASPGEPVPLSFQTGDLGSKT